MAARNTGDDDNVTDDEDRQAAIDRQTATAAALLAQTRRVLDLDLPGTSTQAAARGNVSDDDDDAGETQDTQDFIIPPGADADVVSEPRKKKRRKRAEPEESDEDDDEDMKIKNPIIWSYFKLGPKPAGWQKFKKNKSGKVVRQYLRAICQVQLLTRHQTTTCNVSLNRVDGNTSAMKEHLKSQHPAQYAEFEAQMKDISVAKDKGQEEMQKVREEIDEYNDMKMGKYFLLL